MLLIPCPWCGERAELEFQNGGELIERPLDPALLDDQQWSDYLFNRSNRKAVVRELWWHQHGCRQWFEMERDTRNNDFVRDSATLDPAGQPLRDPALDPVIDLPTHSIVSSSGGQGRIR